MPVNPGIEYQKAEREYYEAETVEEKLRALRHMLQTVPSHKGAENLRADIKSKISKYLEIKRKERTQRKGKKSKLSIKKEGAATVTLVGATNSGKSTLLSKITNTKPLIAEYKFTTKTPEIGMMDYQGVKIQIIEVPSLVKEFYATKNGLALLSIVRTSDLAILLFRNEKEKELVKRELKEISVKKVYYRKEEDIKDKIWKNLDLIKVYTKTPGKEKEFPPIALKQKSTVRDIAEHVHKDFIKKFRFARLWGNSVKHQGSQVGLDHVLKDNDVVELHLR